MRKNDKRIHPESENYKFWTPSEELQLEKLVSTNDKSFKEIGKIMSRSGQSCQSHSILLGFNNKYIQRKYTYKKDFWNIPNLENCYYIGFSAADASVKKTGKNQFLYILEIQKRDKEWLELFQKKLEHNGPIYEMNRQRKTCISTTCKFNISAIEWEKPLLENFNIKPKKCHRLGPPNLNNDYLNYSYLIGYIDGDGTIFYNKVTNNLMINFVSSSPFIIDWVKEIIDKKFSNCYLRKKESKVRKSNHAEVFLYNISGIKACVVFDYLSKFPLPKLSRKWENPEILEFIEQNRQKYPHLFIQPPDFQEIQKLLPESQIQKV